MTESEIDSVLKQYSDKKMFKLILKALLMANEFQGKLSSDTLVFSETCIEISLPPKVSIKYLHKDISNFTRIETEFN